MLRPSVFPDSEAISECLVLQNLQIHESYQNAWSSDAQSRSLDTQSQRYKFRHPRYKFRHTKYKFRHPKYSQTPKVSVQNTSILTLTGGSRAENLKTQSFDEKSGFKKVPSTTSNSPTFKLLGKMQTSGFSCKNSKNRLNPSPLFPLGCLFVCL